MMIDIITIQNYLNESNLSYVYCGKPTLCIKYFSSIFNPRSDSITWIKKINDFNLSTISSDLNLIIVANHPANTTPQQFNFIFCDNPKEVFFSILNHFWPSCNYPPSISSSSTVLTQNIGENVYVGHNSYVSENAVIGDNVVIMNNVSIEERVTIGANTLIHSGVVIGTDGYGLYKDENGLNQKVPHYGGVVIGKNVEIGANTCIARGTLDDTIIGDNVKIDNLCHIAHNVCIMNNCCIVAASVISGSSIIGENSYIAPNSAVMNQLSIGKNSMVGLGAVVIQDVPDNCKVFGCPARVISKKNK